MSRQHLALPLVTVLIWSGNTIVTKMAAGAIHPSVIAFDRWLLAFLLLTPFVLRRAWMRRAVIRPHLPKLAVLGLLGMAAYQGLAYYAAATTSATNMGIIVALVPLLTLGLGGVVLREPPGRAALAGGALSLVGILVVVGRGNPAHVLAQGLGRGDALMLVACLAYAAYGVFLRRWPLPLPVWTSLYLQIACALVFLLPGFLLAPPSPLTWANGAMILYAGIPTSVVAPALWMQGVKHLGPGRTAVFINLMPVLTALMAAVLLREALHAYHVLGGGLTLAGILLAQRPPKAAPAGLAGARG